MESIPDNVAPQRDETPRKRLDRHWNELLQELRVTQTGVQILFAFLLILPFQDRFEDLDGFSHALYSGVLTVVAVSMILNLTPVIAHRWVYTRNRRGPLLRVSHVLSKWAFVVVALALLGAVLLAIDMVLGRNIAFVIVGVLGLLIIALWAVLPLRLRQEPAAVTEPTVD